MLVLGGAAPLRPRRLPHINTTARGSSTGKPNRTQKLYYRVLTSEMVCYLTSIKKTLIEFGLGGDAGLRWSVRRVWQRSFSWRHSGPKMASTSFCRPSNDLVSAPMV